MHKTIHITRFLGKSIKGTDIKPIQCCGANLDRGKSGTGGANIGQLK